MGQGRGGSKFLHLGQPCDRDAAPLPTPSEAPAPEAIGPPCTKKAVLLALYRAHPDYGDRSRASRVAAELAAQAGLQAGTARSYLYAELDGRAS